MGAATLAPGAHVAEPFPAGSATDVSTRRCEADPGVAINDVGNRWRRMV
jgi:hypothetical protein